MNENPTLFKSHLVIIFIIQITNYHDLNTITIVPLLSGHSSVMKGGLIRGVASPEGDN